MPLIKTGESLWVWSQSGLQGVPAQSGQHRETLSGKIEIAFNVFRDDFKKDKNMYAVHKFHMLLKLVPIPGDIA